MAADVEILRAKRPPAVGEYILNAFAGMLSRSGLSVVTTSRYRGEAEWLVLFGVGANGHHEARDRHVMRGGAVLLWDMGYYGKPEGYVRFSLNRDHPQHLLDKAPSDPSRWDRFGISLREDYDPDGPIVLVGLGPKQRAYIGRSDWELRALEMLRERFPDQRIVFRPKRPSDPIHLDCDRMEGMPIETVLKGASLVVCRHSNVAVDAVVAGVPFEAEDGAAMWLKDKDYTRQNRLDFLRRLAWFQWKPKEAAQAWQFIRGIA